MLVWIGIGMIWRIFFTIVHLLSLKLLIFILIITFFWTLRVPLDCTIFYKKQNWGSMAPDPYHESESTSLQGYRRVWYVIFDLK